MFVVVCYVYVLSCVRLFATPWTVAFQAPLSVGFSRQDYWSGLPFPTAGDLPNPGVETTSPALAGGFFTTEPPGKQTLFLTSCPSYFSWQEGSDSILCGLNHRSHLDLEMEKSMIHKNISECPQKGAVLTWVWRLKEKKKKKASCAFCWPFWVLILWWII